LSAWSNAWIAGDWWAITATPCSSTQAPIIAANQFSNAWAAIRNGCFTRIEVIVVNLPYLIQVLNFREDQGTHYDQAWRRSNASEGWKLRWNGKEEIN
jgi:hypothetical protein